MEDTTPLLVSTTPPTAPAERRRIHAMDELRGLLLLLMIVQHALFTLGYLFSVRWAADAFDWSALFLHPVGASLFVMMCGISCHLSHSNLARGLKLAGVAILVSLVLWLVMPEEMIWFGILHCLAACILLYAALKPLLAHIPAGVGLAVCVLLAAITWQLADNPGSGIGIPGLLWWPIPEAVSACEWLSPLGLAPITSSDYFPLLPWFFVFLAGAFIGVPVAKGKCPDTLYRSRCPALAWVGRHTLWLYVIHQPIIYAVCWLIFAVL